MSKSEVSAAKHTPGLLADAYKSDELCYHIREVLAVDEKTEPENLPAALIVSEAQYVLEKFTVDTGFEQFTDYLGHNGPDAKKEARANVRAIKAFLKKHAAIAKATGSAQ